MKKLIFTFVMIALLVVSVQASEKEDDIKCRNLFKKGKYKEALQVAEESIKKYGDTEIWLTSKFHIQMELKRYKEALETALHREKRVERQYPWQCLEIARLCLKLNLKERVFQWLNKAADKGFKDYINLTASDEYNPLRKDKRFTAVIQRIRDNVGIGKPIRDFTAKLFTGESFTLSQLKGKVVLVDFWSTLCPPCVKEIPAMRKDYARFKDKGFEIIGISLDSNRKKLTAFLKTYEMPWLLAFSGKGWNDKTAAMFNVYSIPSTWLVDKKGILRYFGLRGKQLSNAIARLTAE